MCGENVVAEEESGEVAELCECLDTGLDERSDLTEVGIAQDIGAQSCVEVLGQTWCEDIRR